MFPQSSEEFQLCRKQGASIVGLRPTQLVQMLDGKFFGKHEQRSPELLRKRHSTSLELLDTHNMAIAGLARDISQCARHCRTEVLKALA